MEDGLCGRGEIQGGNVEIVSDGAVAQWKNAQSTVGRLSGGKTKLRFRA